MFISFQFLNNIYKNHFRNEKYSFINSSSYAASIYLLLCGVDFERSLDSDSIAVGFILNIILLVFIYYIYIYIY